MDNNLTQKYDSLHEKLAALQKKHRQHHNGVSKAFLDILTREDGTDR